MTTAQKVIKYLALAFAVFLGRTEGGTAALALEYADASFASEKNDLLFNCGKPVKALHIAGTYARLAGYFRIDLDRKLVEAAVEGDGIDVDVCPQNPGGFCAHRAGLVYNLLTEVGQKNSYILKAVLVTAGIEDTVCVDADHILRT